MDDGYCPSFSALHADGTVSFWMVAENSRPSGFCSTPPPSVTSGSPPVTKVVANLASHAALHADGTVSAWGNTEQHLTGGTAPTSVSSPTSPVVDIVKTIWSFSSLHADGRVVSWGNGCCEGSPYETSAPTSPVIAIGANDDAYAALHDDGSVVVWAGHGYYNTGEAALNNVNGRIPTMVASPPDGHPVIGIASTQHSFAALVVESIRCDARTSINSVVSGYLANRTSKLINITSSEACSPLPSPYSEEASLSFGPAGEHKLNCKYTVGLDGNFDMANTGCTFDMLRGSVER
jgi:hypothetical protein